MKKKILQFSGFTLMEVVIAMGIFSVVILIALQVFISVIKVQAEAIPNQKKLTETRTIMELILREWRTGSNYSLLSPSSNTPLCPEEAKEFCAALMNQKGESISFYLNKNNEFHRVRENPETHIFSNEILGNSSERGAPFSSWDVLISKTGEKPEMITFVFITLFSEDTPIILQTTVTSRNYENF